MALIPDNELKAALMDAGNRLLKPPSEVDDLLSLLDELERFLQNVEQSPSESMLNALCPSMKALVAKELLRHSNMDVNVTVASCISEITRITAPDAPYDDELMKEIFQMIVASFENLFDLESRSYFKRLSILETVAKIRSCVVMLDLECDTLILEMFHHFLKSIRDYHSGNVFMSMATIMTMVLEESEDISSELLSSLLASVKKENKEFSSTACRLGEKVIGKCALKLKPYLLQEVQSMGLCLDNYSKIVTSICQETFDTMENEDFQAEDRKISERSGFDEPPQVAEKLVPETPGDVDAAVDKSPKSVMSNGTTQTMSENMLVDTTSPNKKPEDSRQSNQSKSTMAGMESDPDNLESSKTAKPEMVADQVIKKTRARKSNAIVHSMEISEKKTQVTSPTGSHNETMSVVSPSQHLPDAAPSKRGRRGSKKKGGANAEPDLPNSPSVEKGNLAGDQVEHERPTSAGVVSEKESEGNSDLETKPLRSLSKKVRAKDETPPTNINSKKETDGISELEAKPQRRSGKKVHTGNASEGEKTSGKLQGEATKRQKGRTTSEKGLTEEVSKEDMVSPSKSVIKASSKDQSHMEESPKTKSKRKRVPRKEETPEVLNLHKDLGENLVGRKVKVWWPDDQMFYYGVIRSFDPVEKKHEVFYVDDEVETLLLSEEKWEFVEGDTVPDAKEQAPDLSSPGGSSEMPRKKKAKTTSDSATKEVKVDTPLKRGGSTSARKSKGNTTLKPGNKPKVDATQSGSRSESVTPKRGSKSKDTTPKTGSKAKDETRKTDSKSNNGPPKTGSKSNNGTPKTGSKSKDNLPKTVSKPAGGTPKTGSKSKDDSPKTNTHKTGSKSNTNGTSSKGKSGSSKVQESEVSAKGKSGSAKAQDNKAKKGRKRRRGV